jgi:hypothetical protein
MNEPTRNFTFTMTENANSAFSAPNDVTISRKLTIVDYLEKNDVEYTLKIAETIYRFLENCGLPLPSTVACFYRTGGSYLKAKFGMEDVNQFFNSLSKEEDYTVEGFVKNAYENFIPDTDDFDGFCKSVSEKGGFARKIFELYRQSREDEYTGNYE